MRSPLAALLVLLTVAGTPPTRTSAEESRTGRIEGRVTDPSGRGQPGVLVAVESTGLKTVTDGEGSYEFSGVPVQTYTVSFTSGANTIEETGVVVTPGQTAQVDVTVSWEIAYAETVTVYSASRRVERVVDAPQAVSVVDEQDIERQAAHGQLPKLLEFTPGAEVTQSGVYDYNLNTRGFNSSLNRRVATLVDGRDPSVPFLGAQEWAAISFPLDDLAGAELLRGPSAALYGKNAASGVLNLTTKQPRYSEGGLVRVGAGELDTFNVDFRWAGYLFADSWIKAVGGVRRSADFERDYPGLPPEVPAARVDDNEIEFGGLRFDKYWGGGAELTLEGGTASVAGPVFQTGIGRIQLLDVERPWARARWANDHWNLQLNYTRRDAPRQMSLTTGGNLALDSERLGIEAQTHWDLAGDRTRLVAGASYAEEDLDSRDPATGAQTLLFEPVDGDFGALFGQLDHRFSDAWKGVVALRWDDSSLHESRLSPKAALVWNPAVDHTLRLTYNEAFQVANYSEFFLQAPAGLPVDLSSVEPICFAEGVDCGFGNGATPVLALGNADLELEKVRSWEIGWSGIFAGSTFVTADYYRSENEDFITDLIPQCGTALGSCATPADRVNPSFGPYAPPAALSPAGSAALIAALQAQLGPSYPLLTNNPDASPLLGAVSYTNFGEVETQGVDLSARHYLGRAWSIQAAYSWFDFDIVAAAPGLSDLLLPNSPEHKASAGLRYTGARLECDLSVRWSDGFRWVVGPFDGLVPSYTTVDANLDYRFGEAWKAGLSVANLFDDEHWESFGGDVLARRAIGHVTYAW